MRFLCGSAAYLHPARALVSGAEIFIVADESVARRWDGSPFRLMMADLLESAIQQRDGPDFPCFHQTSIPERGVAHVWYASLAVMVSGARAGWINRPNSSQS